MSPATASRSGGALPWLVVTGVLVAALSLRSPVVAPSPVLRDIATDLGVSDGAVALLTTAPVLMFAVLTPLAALVIRRFGAELALLVSLSVVLAGTVIRALPGFEFMLAGSVVIGAGITVGNVVIPVIVRRDVPPQRVSTVLAAYVAMLNAGSLITALLTAPLAALIGWPLALLSWSTITVAGIALWSVHLRRARASERRRATRSTDSHPTGSDASTFDPRTLTGPTPVVVRRARSAFVRNPITWLLMLTFGCQAFVYYGLTTWLPALSADLLSADRTTAGIIASVFQGVAVIGAFAVPLITRVTRDWVAASVISLAWVVLTVGILLAPELMTAWLVVGAIAHSGGFVVIFTALVIVSRSDAEAGTMSALVQGGGYALAALGGPVIGWLREETGSWTSSLVLLVTVSILYGVLLLTSFALARSGRR